jgi:hypothetical protein
VPSFAVKIIALHAVFRNRKGTDHDDERKKKARPRRPGFFAAPLPSRC